MDFVGPAERTSTLSTNATTALRRIELLCRETDGLVGECHVQNTQIYPTIFFTLSIAAMTMACNYCIGLLVAGNTEHQPRRIAPTHTMIPHHQTPTPSSRSSHPIPHHPSHPTSSHSGGGWGREGMRTENSRSTLGRSVGGAPTGNQQEINTESTTIGSGRGEYLSVGCVFMVVAEWEGGLMGHRRPRCSSKDERRR